MATDSPRTDFDVELYPTETWKTIAQIAYESTEFVFDGSDQMPGEVGSGLFWRDMTAWISGGQDAKTTLDNIEASWPQWSAGVPGGRPPGTPAPRPVPSTRPTEQPVTIKILNALIAVVAGVGGAIVLYYLLNNWPNCCRASGRTGSSRTSTCCPPWRRSAST